MKESFLPWRSIRSHLLFGLTTIAFLVFAVGGWAATMRLSGAVVTSGIVVVAGNTKTVEHASGGIVAHILVQEGEYVEEAALLVQLDDTETRANLSIIQNRLDELTSRDARLSAERSGLHTISFPDSLSKRIDNIRISQLIEEEQRFIEARRKIREGQEDQLAEQVTQYGREIDGLNAQISGNNREIILIETELSGIRTLLELGHIAISRVNTFERDLARLEGNRGALLATIARVEGQISETKLQILQIESQFQAEIANEISQVRAEIGELSERAVAAREQLRRMDIRAPQNGIVHGLSVHIIDAVITAGVPIMRIVPTEEDLVIEIKIEPKDIDQIYQGQVATLRFSAFNQRTTPEIIGTVSRIGADLTFDQTTGAAFYVARIEIPEAERARLGAVTLLPGMPVEAFMETEQRTPLSFLMKPFYDNLARSFREQ